MNVNYDYLVGKRVKVVGGYQNGATGTVIVPTYVAAGGSSAWIVTILPDEDFEPNGVLGTDPDGMLVASITAGYVEAMEDIAVPNENGIGNKWVITEGTRVA